MSKRAREEHDNGYYASEVAQSLPQGPDRTNDDLPVVFKTPATFVLDGPEMPHAQYYAKLFTNQSSTEKTRRMLVMD